MKAVELRIFGGFALNKKMMGFGFVIVCLILGMFTMIHFKKPLDHQNTPSIDRSLVEESHDKQNRLNMKTSSVQLTKGQKYVSVLDIYANDEPKINGADAPAFKVESNKKYLVERMEENFVRINDENGSGWIPYWYFVVQADEIQTFKKNLRIVQEPAHVYLYPDAQTPLYDENDKLDKGKVLNVLAKFNQWYLVDYVHFDSPYYDPTWIEKKYTRNYSVEFVQEGRTKQGTYFRDKKGRELKENGTVTGVFKIEQELGSLYEVSGAGGQSGYIKKDDFIPYAFE